MARMLSFVRTTGACARTKFCFCCVKFDLVVSRRAIAARVPVAVEGIVSWGKSTRGRIYRFEQILLLTKSFFAAQISWLVLYALFRKEYPWSLLPGVREELDGQHSELAAGPRGILQPLS